MTNVIIWARVSSREQREGYSIDAQLRATRERAQKNGWTVVREFAVAESAKRGAERLAFNEMFDWVRRNARKEKIESLLAHKLDRVCRNMRDAVRLQELEDQCGVQLAFVDNQFGPGAAGLLSFNVMAAVAQYYSDNLRTEVLKGMEEKIKQGWPMGRASFGYQNMPDRERPVVPHPERAVTVRRIYELYSSGAHTFSTLADQLATEGHFYGGGRRKFTRTALSYILSNPAYIGEIHRHGVVHRAKFQPLIDRSTWNACQDVLHGRNRRKTDHRHPFNGGILRCAHCGASITAEVIMRKLKDGSRREHVYYRCANNDPAPDHPKFRWTQAKLEEAIVADLATIRLPDSLAEWFRETIKAAFSDRERLVKQLRANLAKRQSELTGMIDRVLSAYLAGLMDEDAAKAKQSALKVELAEVEEQLAHEPTWDPRACENALAVFNLSQKAGELWLGSTTVQKRELLDAICLNRMLGDVSLVLEKRSPFNLLAEGRFSTNGRPHCRFFEPSEGVRNCLEVFAKPLEPIVLQAVAALSAAA